MNFYLQQAGNPLLQPLESANIKIKAAQYRILAQSFLKNGRGIDITVHYHHPTHPQRYRYHQQINDEGNVVIMPVTYFHPGRWDIHCCSDLMGELGGEYWQASLSLQIEDPIEENKDNLPQNPSSLPLTADSLEPTVNLMLEVEEITRRWGEPIAIAGQIEIENRTEEIDCLQYEIYDPFTQDCLYQQQQPLNPQSSFFAFHHTLTLPETIKSTTLDLIVQVLTVKGECYERQTLTIQTEMPKPDKETFESVQYTLELSDITTNISYTYDISIEQPIHSLPISVHLPNPQTSLKSLRKVQKSVQPSLPPRLFDDKVTSRRRLIQLPTFS
ncbi:MAG: hypothetical protein AB4041_02385 [Microcystaceae cyanobacterium]